MLYIIKSINNLIKFRLNNKILPTGGCSYRYQKASPVARARRNSLALRRGNQPAGTHSRHRVTGSEFIQCQVQFVSSSQ